MKTPILEIRDLSLSYKTDEGVFNVLKNINLTIEEGEIVGLVGESGGGKSSIVKTILGTLAKNATIHDGQILFDGYDLLQLDEAQLSRNIRGSKIGFIPQDPYLSFNPVFTVGKQLLEIMRWHMPNNKNLRYTRAVKNSHKLALIELMAKIQLPEPRAALDKYPHQFSGGQRQRLLIAAALICSPKLIIADEPTTALDVTTQKGILKLIKNLASKYNVAFLFVTHDLGVVAQTCTLLNVIRFGEIVENGLVRHVLFNPQHEYTQNLVSFHPDNVGSLKVKANT